MDGLFEQFKALYPAVTSVSRKSHFCMGCQQQAGHCSVCHISNFLISVICDQYGDAGVQHLNSMARGVKDELKRRSEAKKVTTGTVSQSLDPRVLVKMMENAPPPPSTNQPMEKDDDDDPVKAIPTPQLSIRNVTTQAVKSAVDDDDDLEKTDVKSPEEYYDSLVRNTWMVDAQEYHKLANEPLAIQFTLKLTDIAKASSAHLDKALHSAVVVETLVQQHTQYIRMMKAWAVYRHQQRFLKDFEFQPAQGREAWHAKMSVLCKNISRTTRYSLLLLGELCDVAPNLVYLANSKHRLIVSDHTQEVLNAMKRYRSLHPTDFRLKWQDPPLGSMLLLSGCVKK